MLSLNKLRIDNESLGHTKFLVSVNPYYKYNEKKERTDEVEGYRYEIALPDQGLEKISVKINGEKMMDAPNGGLVPVDFEGLEVKVYIIQGNPVYSAKATKIFKVKG